MPYFGSNLLEREIFRWFVNQVSAYLRWNYELAIFDELQWSFLLTAALREQLECSLCYRLRKSFLRLRLFTQRRYTELEEKIVLWKRSSCSVDSPDYKHSKRQGKKENRTLWGCEGEGEVRVIIGFMLKNERLCHVAWSRLGNGWEDVSTGRWVLTDVFVRKMK